MDVTPPDGSSTAGEPSGVPWPGHPADAGSSVLVVDGSAQHRNVVCRAIAESAALRLVGVARDGAAALHAIDELDPDLVLLDLELPGMTGLEILRRLRAHEARRPLVVVSTANGARDAATTIEALTLGAVDYVLKPTARDSVQSVADRLLPRLEALATGRAAAPLAAATTPMPTPTPITHRLRAIVIAAANGSLPALEAALLPLGADFPVPIVVVQPMPARFTAALAEHLARRLRLRTVEARDGMPLAPGTVYIAPGERHLALLPAGEGAVARVVDDEPVAGLRPSADVLFRSCAVTFGRQVLAAVFAGMGRDGADGARALAALGAPILTQRAATCAFHGMPLAVEELGLSHGSFAPAGFAEAIRRFAFAW